jgi:hypothetical protein
MGVEYKDIIKSVSDNQFQILHSIQKLYLNGEDYEMDPTYSKGGFYNQGGEYNINPPKYKFDVFPIADGVEKIEPLGKWPVEINSIKSIVIDLPFVCSGNVKEEQQNDPHSCIIVKRFSGYYPVHEIFRSYYHFIYNAFKYLKPGGFCVFKTQSTISGSKKYLTPYYSIQVAENIGFYTIDEFILTAKARIIGNIKKQEHSRCFHSHFLVFQKPDGSAKTKPINYYKWKNTL